MRNLSNFTPSNYSLKTRIRYVLWKVFEALFVKGQASISSVRVAILRLFGAKIGSGVRVRRGVKVHFPWNLEIGNRVWIGEEVWFINHELITIGNDVCISQRSVLCSGGHDFLSKSLEYKHAPILVGSGVWICLDVKVLPGSIIEDCAVISCGEIVSGNVPEFTLLKEGQFKKYSLTR